MAFYWVNLGTSHKEVKDFKFLWAPAYSINKNGKKVTNKGWEQVPKIQKDDVIFCHKKGSIIYIAKAKKAAYAAKRPKSRTYKEWKSEGYKVDVSLKVLDEPVSVDVFKDEFTKRFNSKCSPVVYTIKNKTAQNYMCFIPDAAALLISQRLEFLPFDISENSGIKQKRITKTHRKALVNARIGQGQFRADVLKVWKNKCPVSNIARPDLLIASHILPWKLSNNEEKLDRYNGIALSPNVDKLFDKGFISFSSKGDMIIHPDFSINNISLLGIDPEIKISGINKYHSLYLDKHHKIFGFK